jgi:hypothetical protein
MGKKERTQKNHAAEPQLELIPLPKPTDTEVEAYDFIRNRLRELGWVVKDPARAGAGQVWTQNQCLSHPHFKAAFGLKRPENIVKLKEKLVWVIEAKAARSQLDEAVGEATTYYCDRVNNTQGDLKAVLASGVAGNENSGYLIRTKINLNGKWLGHPRIHPVAMVVHQRSGADQRDSAHRRHQ